MNIKNIFTGLGKIITFLALLTIFIILVYRLILDFNKINNTIVIFLLITVGGMIIIIMPEIKKFNFFGFGLEKELPTFDTNKTESTTAKSQIKNNN